MNTILETLESDSSTPQELPAVREQVRDTIAPPTKPDAPVIYTLDRAGEIWDAG